MTWDSLAHLLPVTRSQVAKTAGVGFWTKPPNATFFHRNSEDASGVSFAATDNP